MNMTTNSDSQVTIQAVFLYTDSQGYVRLTNNKGYQTITITVIRTKWAKTITITITIDSSYLLCEPNINHWDNHDQ